MVSQSRRVISVFAATTLATLSLADVAWSVPNDAARYKDYLKCSGYTSFRLFRESKHPEWKNRISALEVETFKSAAHSAGIGLGYSAAKIRSDLASAGDSYAAQLAVLGGAKGKAQYDQDEQFCFGDRFYNEAVARAMAFEQEVKDAARR